MLECAKVCNPYRLVRAKAVVVSDFSDISITCFDTAPLARKWRVVLARSSPATSRCARRVLFAVLDVCFRSSTIGWASRHASEPPTNALRRFAAAMFCHCLCSGVGAGCWSCVGIGG